MQVRNADSSVSITLRNATMGEPSENVNKRRRWPWVVLAALLLIGGPIALRFRPLNANESQLVGPWKQVLDYEQFCFTSDRRFTVQGYGVYGLQDGTVTSSGSWCCRGDRLVLNYDETWEDLGFQAGPDDRRWEMLPPIVQHLQKAIRLLGQAVRPLVHSPPRATRTPPLFTHSPRGSDTLR